MKTTESFTVTQLKLRSRDLLSRVLYGRQRLIITSYLMKCALIPIEDLRKLEDFEAKERDRKDVSSAL